MQASHPNVTRRLSTASQIESSLRGLSRILSAPRNTREHPETPNNTKTGERQTAGNERGEGAEGTHATPVSPILS